VVVKGVTAITVKFFLGLYGSSCHTPDCIKSIRSHSPTPLCGLDLTGGSREMDTMVRILKPYLSLLFSSHQQILSTNRPKVQNQSWRMGCAPQGIAQRHIKFGVDPLEPSFTSFLSIHSPPITQSPSFSPLALHLLSSVLSMQVTQSFRLIGRTEIEEIHCHYVDGQYVVYWEDIQQIYPGANHVKSGNVAVQPLRDLDQNR